MFNFSLHLRFLKALSAKGVKFAHATIHLCYFSDRFGNDGLGDGYWAIYPPQRDRSG